MLSLITEFRGAYDFLSNFYTSEIVFENVVKSDDVRDIVFPTVEHAYQWQKASFLGDHETCNKIEIAKTPSEAKKLGRKAVGNLEKWEAKKLAVMSELLFQKFHDPVLKEKLISTYPHILIEGNAWHDRFWGVSFEDWTGMNWLGLLLMEVRNVCMYSRLEEAKNF